MVVGDMHGCGGCARLRGHAWLQGGLHGCRGLVHTYRGSCMVAGGVHGCGGHAWCQGVGACMKYDEIRSMSGQYASYWDSILCWPMYFALCIHPHTS